MDCLGVMVLPYKFKRINVFNFPFCLQGHHPTLIKVMAVNQSCIALTTAMRNLKTRKRKPLALPPSKRNSLSVGNLVDLLIMPSRCVNSSQAGMSETLMH